VSCFSCCIDTVLLVLARLHPWPRLASPPRPPSDLGLGTARASRPVVETRTSHVAGRLTATKVAEPYSASSSGPTTWEVRVSTTRAEEHTAELQSPDHLVCRLALGKKTAPLTIRCPP